MSKFLSEYFSGVGVKRLSAVEIDKKKSNQHELNGTTVFKKLFGTEKIIFNGKIIYLTDSEEDIIESNETLTWYDSRENHESRSEHRLYYTENQAIRQANPGDLIIIALKKSNDLLMIVVEQGSTVESQLLWLFGYQEVQTKFLIKDFSDEKKDIGYPGRYIFSSLGIEVEESAPDYLAEIIKRFGEDFPTTKDFSEFARSTVKDVSPIEEPDITLIRWLEREELLFKTLENKIVKKKLEIGFGHGGTDVDEFIKFSLSVQNRRKSRAGHSFEHNLAIIFDHNKIHFSKGAITERNNKPDFLFPGKLEYHDPKFNTSLLTMLGVKTTAKDRWRQVLSEAAKVPEKHLITLEPAISRNQTEDMIANNLQLIIPAPLFSTYSKIQQTQLMTLKGFIEMINGKQKQYSATPLLF